MTTADVPKADTEPAVAPDVPKADADVEPEVCNCRETVLPLSLSSDCLVEAQSQGVRLNALVCMQ